MYYSYAIRNYLAMNKVAVFLKAGKKPSSSIDFGAAQASPVVGYVSPQQQKPVKQKKTRPLPVPDFSKPYQPPAVNPPQPVQAAPDDRWRRPKTWRVETNTPMTPELASLANEEVRGTGNTSTVPGWQQWQMPAWNPWHPGYTRTPTTVDPRVKNPLMHDESAYQEAFGPRHANWKDDNPAGWFNFASAAKHGITDDEAWFANYRKSNGPSGDPSTFAMFPGLVPPQMNYSDIEPRNSDSENVSQQAWTDLQEKYPEVYTQVKNETIQKAHSVAKDRSPFTKGPYTNMGGTYLDGRFDPYSATIFAPLQSDVNRGYADQPEQLGGWSPYRHRTMLDFFSPSNRERVGIHEATHNITIPLGNDRGEIVSYPFDDDTNLTVELPTVAAESFWNTGGKFIPEVYEDGTPVRDADDTYMQYIMPKINNFRLSNIGEPIDYHTGNNLNDSKFWSQYEMDSPVGATRDEYLYNSGVRYWNMPHDPNKKRNGTKGLRFIPDHPVGWAYDRYGNKILSGGELVNYQDLYDGKPKNMEDLPPNWRRYLENLGQAPQAWIDAIERPEEFAAAQDRVRRELFPLVKQDVLGQTLDGSSAGLELLRKYQHPAYQLAQQLLDGRDIADLSDQERANLVDQLDLYYPELRLDPVATPSYLVNAQNMFGILPEMGVTGVRSIDQYNDIARYIDYNRELQNRILNTTALGGNNLTI